MSDRIGPGLACKRRQLPQSPRAAGYRRCSDICVQGKADRLADVQRYLSARLGVHYWGVAVNTGAFLGWYSPDPRSHCPASPLI